MKVREFLPTEDDLLAERYMEMEEREVSHINEERLAARILELEGLVHQLKTDLETERLSCPICGRSVIIHRTWGWMEKVDTGEVLKQHSEVDMACSDPECQAAYGLRELAQNQLTEIAALEQELNDLVKPDPRHRAPTDRVISGLGWTCSRCGASGIEAVNSTSGFWEPIYRVIDLHTRMSPECDASLSDMRFYKTMSE